MKSLEDPHSLVTAAAVLADHKTAIQMRNHSGEDCEVSKLVDDRDSKSLHSSTGVVRDVKSACSS